MVERRSCNFCGNNIEPGTGRMYIRTDGTVFYFDRHKCYTNFVKLRRIPRETRWSGLSSAASRWKDKPGKQKTAVPKRFVPKDLSSRLRKEHERMQKESEPRVKEEVQRDETKQQEESAEAAEVEAPESSDTTEKEKIPEKPGQ
jgi:large subunit ribosomal protein L24e